MKPGDGGGDIRLDELSGPTMQQRGHVEADQRVARREPGHISITVAPGTA